MAQSKSVVTRQDGAYTLVEMMVVMVILIVVMALVAPVIGNARNAAKKTNTRQLLNNLAQASQQFEIDNRSQPGYFNPVEMGDPANGTRGFSEMNNILLDLAGGRVDVTGTPPLDAMQVGPTTTAQTYVRVGLIGAPTQTRGVVNKGYFTPDPKYFVLHQSVDKKATSVAAHFSLPDVIDGFGQPLLAWRQDLEPREGVAFAEIDSGNRASFYLNGNAAFLNATKLGKKEQDQSDDISGSLLGANFNAASQIRTMGGLLGNPAFPSADTNGPAVPAASRGKIMFHSAGTDGVFLGMKDRGGLIATRPGAGAMDYQSGKDPMDDFDDVFSVAGN